MVAIFVNMSANNSLFEKRLRAVEDIINNHIPFNKVIVKYSPPFDMIKCIRKLLLEQECNIFLSVGGDGSINYLLNSLINIPEINIEDCVIGGIGLGSSNDFYKPFDMGNSCFPLRLNFENTKKYDIGHVKFTNEQGFIEDHYFINNASVGLVAEANYLFNNGDYIIKHLKSVNVLATIYYSAFKTLLNYTPIPLRLIYDKSEYRENINNLSIIKNPYVSGNFKYEQKILPDDRQLGLNFFYDANMAETIVAMKDLMKSNFVNKKSKKRISQLVNALDVYSENFINLETDGEVRLAKNIHFSIYPKQIGVLGLGCQSNFF